MLISIYYYKRKIYHKILTKTMIHFNVWAESLEKYIYLKYLLLFVIWIIIFIIIYDFIKLIIIYYKKNINYKRNILEIKQTIIKEIDILLDRNGIVFIKDFLSFIEKNINIWKYSMEKLLEHINYKKEDFYKIIYSKNKKNYRDKEEKIKELLLEYRNWLKK